MPRAHGTDRLASRADGTLELTCDLPKGWRGRTPGTHTSAPHPGAAVSWEEEIYEVLEATPLADGRTRYRLSVWEPRHAIRTLDQYDVASETARTAGRAERAGDLRKRRVSILLAPLLGHLPGAVQEDMEKEFGAPALAMTFASALPLFVVGVLSALSNLVAGFGARLLSDGAGNAALFPWLRWVPAPLGLFLLAESTVRLASALAAGRPCGSLLGVLGYEIWRAAGGRRRAGLETRSRIVPDRAREQADRFRVLEPLLALLRPEEQSLLASRFGFDPIRWGRRTANFLLAFAGINIVISLLGLAARTGSVADSVWLVVGAAVALEQVARRRVLARGLPAGSLLGALVRPLARELLRPGT